MLQFGGKYDLHCDSLSYVRNVLQPYGKAIARYVNQRVC